LARGRGRKVFLTLAAGALMGSLVGVALGDLVPVLAKGVSIGIDPPVRVDLLILRFPLGFVIRLNLASALGILVAMFFLRRL